MVENFEAQRQMQMSACSTVVSMDISYPEIDGEDCEIKGCTCVTLPVVVSSTEGCNGGNSNDGIHIHLSVEEVKLFETLEATARAYEAGQLHLTNDDIGEVGGKRPEVQIRVAGGWVRDKLLKNNSYDVDVALDCMSGVQFATLVQMYLKSQSEEVRKIGVIAANPSQSKHLETAAMRVHGTDVDFVNLRAQEIYDENSRIPTTRFGTPLEDALRRDFTVNSLFYNIRSHQIEDCTGRGIQDLLQNKLLVTPLNPHTTFHDDPLRVLRAVRFSVRFDLILHQDIRDAAMSSKVQHSLHVKVSRERVGKELEGMLSGKRARPGVALDLITQLKLAGTIFCFPPVDHVQITGLLIGTNYADLTCHQQRAQATEEAWLEATKLIQCLPKTLQILQHYLKHQRVNNSIATTSIDERLLYLSVFLLPFRNLSYLDKKEKVVTVVSYMIRESIKFKNKDIIAINSIMEHFDQMKLLWTRFHNRNLQQDDISEVFCRLQTGLLLRNLKEFWLISLVGVTVDQLASLDKTIHDESKIGEIDRIHETTCKFYSEIINHNLDGCWKQRPLLDGRALIQTLQLPKGPFIGKYLDKQIQWMLLNPNGTKEECGNYLKNLRKRELESQTDEQNATPLGILDGENTSSNDMKCSTSTNKTSRHKSKRMHIENVPNL